MKTRILYTSFWEDRYVRKLSRDEKLLFSYYLTNEKINLSGVYEISEERIMFDLKFSEKVLREINRKFHEDEKIVFFEEFVRIINNDKYNKYTGTKNDVAKEKELLLAPKDILNKDTLSIPYPYPIDTSIIHTNQNHNLNLNTKQIGKKEYLKSNECFKSLFETFPKLDEDGLKKECVVMFDWLSSKGKTQKDYSAFARNWIRKNDGEGTMKKKIIKNELPVIKKEESSDPEKVAKIKEDIKKMWKSKSMDKEQA